MQRSLNKIYKLSFPYRTFASAVPKREAQVDTNGKQENLSFMANIFRGNLQTAQVFPYPDVLDAEQKELACSLVDPLEKFFENINNPERNDTNSKIDDSTLNALREMGAFGKQVPIEYGGLGLNNTQYGRVCEIVGANDLAVGVTLGAHQSIGFKGILLYGTPEQKAKYLPKLAAGKVYAAYALTEPSSGSDASSIRSRAVKSADGKHYILNGSKIWISNGGIAEIFTTFAQTEQLDKKTGQMKDKITAFIVERAFGGVSSGPPESKMGINASNTAEVYFEDVKIPIENVLGEEGEGFKVAMNILNNGRFGMGASMSGTMKHCIKKATEHATQRVQFGNKISNYEAIQEKLAQMNMLQYATESMAYTISQNMDGGSEHYHLEAAISKVFGSESAWFVCDEAIQILGGMGFMKSAGLERVMRDLRTFRIFEGSNDILRLFVALTGVQYAGSHLKELQQALKSPANNFGIIMKEASRRLSSNVGMSGVDLNPYVAPQLQAQAKECSSCIDMFGQTVETLLVKHGKNIVQQQFLLNNLANSAIDIYAMVVTLSRATRAIELNLPTAEHETNLTKGYCIQATRRTKRNLRNVSAPAQLELYQTMRDISKVVYENGGVYTTHVITG